MTYSLGALERIVASVDLDEIHRAVWALIARRAHSAVRAARKARS